MKAPPRLNRRLTLENATRTSDGAGGFVESWASLGVLWASVLPRTGRDSETAEAPVSAVSFKIVVRAAPIGHVQRPVAEQRFRDGSRLFQIRAVTEFDVEGRYLTCFADEEVAP
ncbi:MAG: phage head closure protein [Paracoccaceae bacterium]